MAQIKYFQVNVKGYNRLMDHLNRHPHVQGYPQLKMDIFVRGRAPGYLFLSVKTEEQENQLRYLLQGLDIYINEYSGEGLISWINAVYILPVETTRQEE